MGLDVNSATLPQNCITRNYSPIPGMIRAEVADWNRNDPEVVVPPKRGDGSNLPESWR